MIGLFVFVVIVIAGVLFATNDSVAPGVGNMIESLDITYEGDVTVEGTLTTEGATTLSSTLSAAGVTVSDNDLTLTDGRVVGGVEGTASDCESNAVTLDLSTLEKTVVVADQASAAACAVTLSNGTAGEIVVLDLVYGGDTAWTIATGGHFGGDTFDEAQCPDFQATAADGDHLIVAGVMIDANTIMPFSCQYLDQ